MNSKTELYIMQEFPPIFQNIPLTGKEWTDKRKQIYIELFLV